MLRAALLLSMLASPLVACGDASPADDVGAEDAGAGSDATTQADPACHVMADSARCDARSIETVGGRPVYWAAPTGKRPKAGWPAVILYQGSLYGPSLSWNTDLPIDTMYGGYYQVALIAQLLEHGFVVIQPEAKGGLFWLTNSGNYDTSDDATFIPELLAQLESGTFDEVDAKRLYATGISSGGYMTSRMAVSYPGRFRALAIQSASYATCLGTSCNVPDTLPDDHPPTLLLHGAKDTIVPIATAHAYHGALDANDIEARFIEDADAAHEWLEVAPSEITGWFEQH